MKSTKHLGIWMDHSIAHLMELTNDKIITNIIESQSKLQGEEQHLKKDKSLMHIEAKSADKMTENQEHTFVREYFNTSR
jgi:hypothetical protein